MFWFFLFTCRIVCGGVGVGLNFPVEFAWFYGFMVFREFARLRCRF